MNIDVWHKFIDVIASAAALVSVSIVVWSSRSTGKPPAPLLVTSSITASREDK